MLKEFEDSNWEDVVEEEEEGKLWQDDWDDEDVNDDFTDQLRRQFEKNASSTENK